MSHLLTLHNPAQSSLLYRKRVWQNTTMYGLVRKHASERSAAFAVRDNQRRLTWHALLQWVDTVAAALHASGLRTGDRVAVWLPNRLENVVIQLACSRNGYVCNPSLHQNYTVAEILTLLQRIDCKALFAQIGWGADAKQYDVFAQAQGLGHIKRMFALPALNAGDSALPLGTQPMPQPGDVSLSELPAASEDPDQVVYLAFTSGTTGAPKGVMHSDNTLLANGRSLSKDWNQDANTVLLTLSPMSHHIGTVALEQVLVTGCELVMLDGTAGVPALDWLQQTGATYVMGVPTHAMDLIQEVDKRQLQKLGNVRVFYMAGAPIPTETASRLLALGATPQNVYGMTECGSHQYTLPHDPVEVITTTCGKHCHGYEVRLFDQENPDREVVQGEVGEIGGRGGLLMLGYFNNQTATEGSFNAGGWFMSGDLGRFDANGNLEIVGRKKDLIIRGGHNIHPAHIEEYAHRHMAVKKAAAFGVPDERLGEKVCLALIAPENAPQAQDMLQHLAAEGLSKFDMPEFYIVLPEFPLTPSGKILKRELIEWVKSGRIQPQPVRYRAPEVVA
ncbi:acyl--CoA ligase [Comamonas sp. Y33R10-2]|uniref:class I adenylate-forming enzyme family protein n=1 Tax=Comamonas sp. Y33R10-2 TaxID=2853257 RepID=UPI001C5CBF4C|nr:class I adenylate-forming enzyme family protein [Comamonas sp. Y33R10-2]QXZ10682.1 acyl--CoA ligase [Comamonas sp. Y33R10-2]